jgi:hypothetical protein
MLCLAVGLFALWAQAGNAQAPTTTTVTFFEGANGTFNIVDNAPKSPARNPESKKFRFSIGDEIAFANPVLNQKGGTRIGTLYGNGTIVKGKTFGSASVSIRVVVAMNNGDQIVAEGVFAFAQNDIRVAVIGGTGTYAGARGSVVSHNFNDGSAQDTLTLIP